MDPVVALVARVGTPGHPFFQLRKGESGLSVFDPAGVDPPLTEEEILDAFRPSSVVVYCHLAEILALGLVIAITPGSNALPERLRVSHREIAPGERMSRPQFKAAIKELEP